MKEVWSDEKLFKKFELTNKEILFIESLIRPMDLSQNDNDEQDISDDE